jgi:hypothetical protein
MRKSIVFCICFAVIALFTACNKDQEGVYNPSKKIQKIYSLNDNGVKELEEVWNWNGKLLSSIVNVDDNYESVFYYDKKQRLTSIETNDTHTAFTYDGKYLLRVVMTTTNGEAQGTIDFVHENDKIVEMRMDVSGLDLDLFKKSVVNSLRFVFPEAIPAVESAVKECPKDAKNMLINAKLIWNGDNVSNMQISTSVAILGTITITTELTYDTKNNPIYGSFASITSAASEIFFLNKNNPMTRKTTLQSTLMNRTLDSAEYSYEYQGNYPTKVICKSTDDDGEVDIETIIYEY